MPVVTRSCRKQKGRPRIEDATPATSCIDRRRYPTRSSVKRKIPVTQQDKEKNDLEPPSKKAPSNRSSRNVSKTSKKLPFQDISNTLDQDQGGGSKSHARKVSRCMSHNNNKKTAKSQPNREVVNSENHAGKGSPSLEKNDGVPDDNIVDPKTPAGCIAARIKSYSAFRRSQKKNQVRSDVDKENASCSPVDPAAVTSLPEEVSPSSITMGEEKESELNSDPERDEDILWRISRSCNVQKEDSTPDSKSADQSSYKEKYFTLLSAMKQIQNTFLRAQQNAEKNVKAYDNFVSNLKSTLSTEQQKNSLLSEELRMKKGSVERLRSELENTKEQLKFMREDKANMKRHEQEEGEKKKDSPRETSETNNKELLQVIEDQKSLISFYSLLTGISMSRENTCEDTSSFHSFNCTFFPAEKTAHRLQFRLTHDTEFDEIEYNPNPKSPGSEDILLNLPNYLQDNMFFGSDQATNFLEKLFKTVKG